MTSLTLGLVAEVARLEVEDRVRRAARMHEIAGAAASGPGIRRRIADVLRAVALRLAPLPAVSETPVSSIASSPAASSRVVNCS